MTDESARPDTSSTGARPTVDRPTDHQPRAKQATVYLHIGTMKTGTSFIQRVLQKNHRLLRQQGVLYPLQGNKWALQVRAARDVLGFKGVPVDGSWATMLEQIHAWEGRASVVSMEFYSLASAEKAQQIVAELAPARVEIILTARDLVRVLPSAWQSMIKQGRPWSFAEFMSSVTGGPGDPDANRRFWRHHDLVEIARRWSEAVGADHVHLITVPPSGAPPSLLWERFCSVVGLEADRYDIDQDQKSNFSLSYSDTELMRQINGALHDELGRVAYKRWATRYFANRVLRASSGEDTAHDRPTLSAQSHAWAIERTHSMLRELKTMGLRVVGDWEELVPGPAGADDEAAEPEIAYPDGAATIIAALLRRIAHVDPALAGKTRPNRRRGGGQAVVAPVGLDMADDDLGDDFDDDDDDDVPARLAWAR